MPFDRSAVAGARRDRLHAQATLRPHVEGPAQEVCTLHDAVATFEAARKSNQLPASDLRCDVGRDAETGRPHAQLLRRCVGNVPLDEEPADTHVVVLEDEDTAAQPRRAGVLEDLLDDPLAGPVGGVCLPGEDDLDGAVSVPQQPGETVHVGEQQTCPLVRREPSGEADRQHARVEDGLDLGEDRG